MSRRSIPEDTATRPRVIHPPFRPGLPLRVAIVPVLLLAAGTLLGGCSNQATPSDSVAAPVALRVGQAAPPLAGTTLDGGSFDLAALRGKPVVVNFWASWCIPCRDEFGLFKSALTRDAASGLTVVGVVFKDDASAARSFAESAAATWPSVTDPSGAMATRYRVVAPPQTYFIDRQGVVRDRQIGEIASDDEMNQLLAEILK